MTRAILTVATMGALFGMGAGMPAAAHQMEYRALWVDTWNPGMLDAESAKLLVARAKHHHFNTLFVEVSKVMDAYYQSDILPKATNIAPDFDPLGTVLHYARQATNNRPGELEVHAWMVALRVWKDKPLPGADLRPAHVMRAHPDWISKNYRGARFEDSNYFLDPGHPEVQEFVASIAREIAQKYPVDGIHLDYIRYPGNEWGYNEVSLKRFQQERNRTDTPEPTDEEWSAWRRQQVNDLVRRVRTEIQKVRPNARLSVAAITWGDVPGNDFKNTRAYQDALQNWVGWIQAGYVDITVPMNYKRANNPIQAKDYLDWVKVATWSKGERHTITGLGAWFNPLDSTLRQIESSREVGANGICFFSYNQMDSEGRQAAHVLRDVAGKTFKSPISTPQALWLDRPTKGTIAGVDPNRRSAYPVALLDSSGNAKVEVWTDANGHFSFFEVPPGNWQVRVGRASIYSKPISVQNGRVSWADF
jgi:uncharacterized lipoprotein YddW (UPF0748 family)